MDQTALGLEVRIAFASHICLTTFSRRHHRRIAGRTMTDHLAALRRNHAAAADELQRDFGFQQRWLLSGRSGHAFACPLNCTINGPPEADPESLM